MCCTSTFCAFVFVHGVQPPQRVHAAAAAAAPRRKCLLSKFSAPGGDAMLSKCLWKAGIAYTDPGFTTLHRCGGNAACQPAPQAATCTACRIPALHPPPRPPPPPPLAGRQYRQARGL